MAEKNRIPTMEDVAKLAGVNRVTVSVVFNNAKANTQVSEATRQRILDAAQQLGYHRNARALALKRQTTDIIGFYAGYNPNLHDPFTAEVINSMQQAIIHLHKDLLVLGQYEEGRSVDDLLGLLMSGRIDGLVMIPHPNQQFMEKIARSKRPVVAIADDFPGIPSVVMDDCQGSVIIAEYLSSQGHKHVMFRSDLSQHRSAVVREEAFLQAAERLGMQVTLGGSWSSDGLLSEAEQAILSSSAPNRPTAVACWADTNAFACVEGCLRLGLRVPEDVAVTGFDGIPTRVRPARALTTIRMPWNQVATKAIQLLNDVMNGEPVPDCSVFPVELLLGDTA